MQKFISKRSMTLLVSVALVFAVGVTPSIAQQRTKISGEMTLTVTKHDTIIIGDTEGHVFSLSAYKGSNKSTGEVKFMDGAQIENSGFSDIVKGNGPHQGYVKLFQNGDAVFAKWQGEVATEIAKDGPVTTFKGNFFYIAGTGQFKGIQGRGTYKGRFTTKTEYIAEWEGEYSNEK